MISKALVMLLIVLKSFKFLGTVKLMMELSFVNICQDFDLRRKEEKDNSNP